MVSICVTLVKNTNTLPNITKIGTRTHCLNLVQVQVRGVCIKKNVSATAFHGARKNMKRLGKAERKENMQKLAGVERE